MKVEKPIAIGAMYRDVSTTDSHGSVWTIVDIWVDEDLETHVKLEGGNGKAAFITARDLANKINTDIIRTNTDREAWEWRNK